MSAELHAMVGAYALDALDERERATFEAHLAGCPTCTHELEEFRATAARLGSAVAVPPSPALRTAVLEAATRTTQERPVVPLRRVSRWRQRAPMLVAAAAVLAMLGAVGAYLGERDRLSELEATDRREAAVLAADDATLTRTREDGTRLRVVSSESLDAAVVVMSGVPPLEDSNSYQMWTIGADGKPRSVGVMGNEDVAGTTSHLVGDLHRASAVAVTVEPEGGSPQPTTKPILSAQLS